MKSLATLVGAPTAVIKRGAKLASAAVAQAASSDPDPTVPTRLYFAWLRLEKDQEEYVEILFLEGDFEGRVAKNGVEKSAKRLPGYKALNKRLTEYDDQVMRVFGVFVATPDQVLLVPTALDQLGTGQFQKKLRKHPKAPAGEAARLLKTARVAKWAVLKRLLADDGKLTESDLEAEIADYLDVDLADLTPIQRQAALEELRAIAAFFPTDSQALQTMDDAMARATEEPVPDPGTESLYQFADRLYELSAGDEVDEAVEAVLEAAARAQRGLDALGVAVETSGSAAVRAVPGEDRYRNVLRTPLATLRSAGPSRDELGEAAWQVRTTLFADPAVTFLEEANPYGVEVPIRAVRDALDALVTATRKEGSP